MARQPQRSRIDPLAPRRINFNVSLPGFFGPDQRLRKSSDTQFFAQCPFHDDSTASLSISFKRERGWVYNCFGCGESGDVCRFIQKTQEIPFREVILKYGSGDSAPPPSSYVPDRVDHLNGKTHLLVCCKCQSESIPIDIRWAGAEAMVAGWEVGAELIAAICPRCLWLDHGIGYWCERKGQIEFVIALLPDGYDPADWIQGGPPSKEPSGISDYEFCLALARAILSKQKGTRHDPTG